MTNIKSIQDRKLFPVVIHLWVWLLRYSLKKLPANFDTLLDLEDTAATNLGFPSWPDLKTLHSLLAPLPTGNLMKVRNKNFFNWTLTKNMPKQDSQMSEIWIFIKIHERNLKSNFALIFEGESAKALCLQRNVQNWSHY